MPEGHTIHRAARRIAAAIGGKQLTGVAAHGPHLQMAGAEQRLAGATVLQVEARGKNLLIHLDNGYSVYSHLKMDGAWHLYRRGERWRRPARFAWLVLEADDWMAVNFGGPVLELHRTDDVLRDTRLTRLGPDVLAEPFNTEEYLRRMRRNDHREVGDAVMQQAIVAGIGNIYKSETLFMCGIDPWCHVADLSDDQLASIRERATTIMNDGVLDPRAITFHGPGRPGHWVYMRSGRPCRRCGGPIVSREQGDDRRTTYWCGRCQSRQQPADL